MIYKNRKMSLFWTTFSARKKGWCQNKHFNQFASNRSYYFQVLSHFCFRQINRQSSLFIYLYYLIEDTFKIESSIDFESEYRISEMTLQMRKLLRFFANNLEKKAENRSQSYLWKAFIQNGTRNGILSVI